MGGLWETVGFAFRVAAAKDVNSFALFMPQQALIVLAPLCKCSERQVPGSRLSTTYFHADTQRC
jgi:hypothetical protein